MKLKIMAVNCGTCQKEFNTYKKRIEAGRGKYCSKSCFYESRYKDVVKEFFNLIDKQDCWIWTGSRGRQGYGQIIGRNKAHGAHRLSYIIHKGEIPDGLFVCHSCDNPSCVNPDHLFLGTNADNQRDAASKGRTAKGDRHGSKTHPERVARGEMHWMAKLKAEDVLAIRELTGIVKVKELSKMFNVSESAIYGVIARSTWGSL